MWKTFLMSCIMMLSVSGVALAHFGMVIPSAGTVTDKKDADVTLDLSFTHPMEMQGMPLAKPKAVQVIANGKTEDLKPSLKAKKIVDHDGWTAQYAIKRPGVRHGAAAVLGARRGLLHRPLHQGVCGGVRRRGRLG